MRSLKRALLVTSGIVIGVWATQLLHAAASPPIYEVAEINVKDQDNYGKVAPKIREQIKALGGKLLAGGYNKSKGVVGIAPPNRILIFVYPNQEAVAKLKSATEEWIEKRCEQVRRLPYL